MNQMTLNVKKNFLSRTFSRCLAEMCPGVVRLEITSTMTATRWPSSAAPTVTPAEWMSPGWIFRSQWRPFCRSSTGRWRDG